jgi:hypothetical protein
MSEGRREGIARDPVNEVRHEVSEKHSGEEASEIVIPGHREFLSKTLPLDVDGGLAVWTPESRRLTLDELSVCASGA